MNNKQFIYTTMYVYAYKVIKKFQIEFILLTYQ